MDSYGPQTYGERVADLYDDWYQDHPDTRVAVERLAELAGPGPVLELGVGTGRLALPLAERDLEVHGIDASPAMLDRLRAKPGGQRVHQQLGVTRVTVDSVLLTASRHDPVGQRIDAQQIQFGPGAGFRLVPGVLRYAWPSELDLMARLAGLRLRERWGGWRREPFTAASTMHVSVYERG
jgi:SAM-dependent methyltransferase